MKKLLPLTLLFVFFLIPAVFLSVSANEMTLDGVSNNLPGKEFVAYFRQAWPEMKKIHGEPFSSFTFTVEGRPDMAEHNGGWFPVEKKVIEDAGPMRNYSDFLAERSEGGAEAGVNSMEQSVTHELAHAMYTWNNAVVTFPYPWANEGWAKTTELVTWARIKGELPRPGIYLTEFLDKDTLGGTKALGRYKQFRNHALVYDNISMASLNLLYGCSGSNSNPDFQIRMDNRIYQDYVVNKKPLLENKYFPEEDYKNMIKQLCAGRKIDGQDAYDWYFSQPANFINGSPGFHLGMTPHWWVYTTVEGLDIYTFDRGSNLQDQEKTENPLSAQVGVEVFDVAGNPVLSKTVQTDQDGSFFLNFGRDLLKNGAYYAVAKTTSQGKVYQSKIFFTNIRDKDGTAEEQKERQNPKEVIGVMVDGNLTPLPSQYLALLKPVGGTKIIANSNGVLLAEVPSTQTREVAFDFAGQRFTFTKPPFWRVVVFKVSDDLIKKAQNDRGFKNYVDKGFSAVEPVAESGKVAQTPFESLITWITNLLQTLKGG